jgi:vancomycin permeability regulator SanA
MAGGVAGVAAVPAFLGISHLAVCLGARGRIITCAAEAEGRMAVVLGAGLRPDGTPTGVLARRVEAAAELYLAGLVTRVVMSGAADTNGDQPRAMSLYAQVRGVPVDAIELDRGGVDTAGTCRTIARLHRHRPVVLITQQFHARRTAYLARKAGLNAVVLATADSNVRPVALARARAREIPAAVKAVWFDDPGHRRS